VQHLFHRFAVPLLLRRRYVLIHFNSKWKNLALISASVKKKRIALPGAIPFPMYAI
jgi:hypothetical protein